MWKSAIDIIRPVIYNRNSFKHTTARMFKTTPIPIIVTIKALVERLFVLVKSSTIDRYILRSKAILKLIEAFPSPNMSMITFTSKTARNPSKQALDVILWYFLLI